MDRKIFLSLFERLHEKIGENHTTPYVFKCRGLSPTLLSALISHETGAALVVTPDEFSAKRACEDFVAMGGDGVFFPAKELALFKKADAVSVEIENARLGVLSRLAKGEELTVFASIEAALYYTISKFHVSSQSFTLKEGDSISIKALTEKLASLSYARLAEVDGPGQFSIRGGIVDISPVASSAPIRLEFFGDEIEAVWGFDYETQRRTKRVESAVISVSSESGSSLGTLLDYFTKSIYLYKFSEIKEAADGFWFHLREDIEKFIEEENIQPLSEQIAIEFAEFEELVANRAVKFEEADGHSAIELSPYGNISELHKTLRYYLSEQYRVLLLAGSQNSAHSIVSELLEEKIACAMISDEKPEKGVVSVAVGSLSSGFELPSERIAVLTSGQHQKRKVLNRRSKDQQAIGSLLEITPGDLVVHASHGIGEFAGLETMKTLGVVKDFIKIKYQGSDVLYVPATSLNMLSKYIGKAEGSAVRLHKLGGATWGKQKSRARSAVKDIAHELIRLYAKRAASHGFAFSPDSDWQMQFEESFDFPETEDQLRATQEIKGDMQKNYPMDRLLCGDVGFGKTEVALRAAFKSVLDGKQCAILCPTTILAWQHMRTATARFADFPVRVEMLSRFVTPKKQKQIVADLAEGKVDIIIGTHRILGQDVKFKDLGLAIIDEEQRFGVSHKEAFSKTFAGVDRLMLSATPIPRTLNMAMSNFRDMSVLETPPAKRLPIQTYVTEYNAGVIIDGIRRELRRGGQVYFIHNRIESIADTAAKIQQKIPEAKVAIAHGQMDEYTLSGIWKKLLDKEIDILVCTTIIETGIDVPNVNTLVIENADRMGLSQLYQLRGRVGRSDRQAYAHFTYRRDKQLSETQQKRLNAIKEFTRFGSGFRIALRDMEIRGAGNILSGEQSGHLENVGYELYLQMLSEETSKLRGEMPKEESVECVVSININAHIDESYISELSSRLDVYKKISSVKSEEDKRELVAELEDRFGGVPLEISELMDISLLRAQAAELGIVEIKETSGMLAFKSKDGDVQRFKIVGDAQNSIKSVLKMLGG